MKRNALKDSLVMLIIVDEKRFNEVAKSMVSEHIRLVTSCHRVCSRVKFFAPKLPLCGVYSPSRPASSLIPRSKTRSGSYQQTDAPENTR